MLIQENDITLPSEGQSLKAFIARPAGAEPRPAIVVIQEIFGLNDNIRQITSRLAQEGYVALALDLYSGGFKPWCVFQSVRALLSSHTDNYGTRHLRNAMTYLSQQPYADVNRLGAIGFCMGGNFALALANEDKRLKTIAPFYSITPRPLKKDVSGLCPVVGSFPGKDFTTKQGKQLAIDLAKANIAHDIKIYPGAKHSFMNDSRSSFHPEAAADAWQRTLAFFQMHL
ncbi:dienelactone hydrolase family protein [Spirosoma spitsbergense]|uniref:dienelactone hydrolase family protein n=1 Tax=Spirosoma spitsbergense TaxID=431554 RepID=UPI00036D1F83|nr:dienelactone hydrolase family protein [Spirosoma spitsbergense]